LIKAVEQPIAQLQLETENTPKDSVNASVKEIEQPAILGERQPVVD
jgi:hypothetical protein